MSGEVVVQGDAPEELNAQERTFVEIFLGLRDYKVAGAACGLSGTEAWNLAHTPKMQAAILDAARKTMRAGTAAATRLLLETVEDEGIERKDRLKAALAVLDRGGIPAVSRTEVQPTAGTMADAALVGFAGALLARFARAPERVVNPADITDI